MRKLRNLVTISCLLGMTAISGCQPKHEQVNEVFDNLVYKVLEEELKHSPELNTQLGQQLNYSLNSTNHLLDDRSLAAQTQIQVTRLEELHALWGINKEKLSSNQKITYVTLENILSTSTQLSNYPFGDVGLFSASPYVISHLDGAYLQLPSFLKHNHKIDNLRDAQEYVERLNLVAIALDDEVERFFSDRERGIYPPDFILSQIVSIAQSLHDAPIDTHPYVTPLQYGLEYLDDLDIQTGQALLNQAKVILETEILPAYASMIEQISQTISETNEFNGLNDLVQGPSYYQATLNHFTSSDKTASEIHTTGLKLVEDLSIELEAMLSPLELEGNTTGEQLAQLSKAEDQLFEDSDEGREALLNSLSENVAAMNLLLPAYFNAPPNAPLNIARIPKMLEDAAPGGYYQSASIHAVAGGTYNINLRDVSDWPKWTLATLTYHEAIPGHHLQSSIHKEADLPLIRRVAQYPAFSEGWAVYAEDLADEMGVYADDPLGRIGYLQSIIFRAARLVVDTGIHNLGWSREQATQYLVDTTGYSFASMQTEVDRYFVWPGQACSYMIGRNEIRRLRQQADLELGNQFDLKEFHSIVLNQGTRPLSVLRNDIEIWLKSKRETSS